MRATRHSRRRESAALSNRRGRAARPLLRRPRRIGRCYPGGPEPVTSSTEVDVVTGPDVVTVAEAEAAGAEVGAVALAETASEIATMRVVSMGFSSWGTRRKPRRVTKGCYRLL